MKRNINLLLTLTVFFAACSNQKEEKKQKQQAAKENVVVVPNEVSLKNDQLNAVYQQYLLLSNALINADLAAAKEASLAIELGTKTIANGNKLTSLAAKMAIATDMDVQRVLFAELSNEMIAKVKTVGLKKGEVYVEHCPMALNDKGASWLSNQKEISNPYYGDSMLDCGEVTETLK